MVTKVFLCVKDFLMIKQMMDIENVFKDVKVVGISTTVLVNSRQLSELQTDVLVLQFSIDKEQATNLLKQISAHAHLQSLKVLCLFKELDSDIIHLLLQHGIQNFLVEPCDMKQFIQAIRLECDKKASHKTLAHNIEAFASEIMMDLGLPAHLNGFGYIKTCALLISQNIIGIRIVMGNMYSETARRHHTTATRVEKSIRTAIHYAFRTQPEKICIYNTKPTSSQVILYISEKLKLYEERGG